MISIKKCITGLILLATTGNGICQSQSVAQTDARAIDSLFTIAIANSPWIKTYEMDYRRTAEDLKQEKKKWLSTFRLGINFFSLTTTVNGNDQSVTTAGLLPNVGLNLGIDPEKFINRGSYLREANYNLERSGFQLQHQLRGLRDEVTIAYFRNKEAKLIYQLRMEANQTQEATCIVLKEKYRRGEIGINDYLLAENGLILTKEALLKATLELNKIQHQLQTLLGQYQIQTSEQ